MATLLSRYPPHPFLKEPVLYSRNILDPGLVSEILKHEVAIQDAVMKKVSVGEGVEVLEIRFKTMLQAERTYATCHRLFIHSLSTSLRLAFHPTRSPAHPAPPPRLEFALNFRRLPRVRAFNLFRQCGPIRHVNTSTQHGTRVADFYDEMSLTSALDTTRRGLLLDHGTLFIGSQEGLDVKVDYEKPMSELGPLLGFNWARGSGGRDCAFANFVELEDAAKGVGPHGDAEARYHANRTIHVTTLPSTDPPSPPSTPPPSRRALSRERRPERSPKRRRSNLPPSPPAPAPPPKPASPVLRRRSPPIMLDPSDPEGAYFDVVLSKPTINIASDLHRLSALPNPGVLEKRAQAKQLASATLLASQQIRQARSDLFESSDGLGVESPEASVLQMHLTYQQTLFRSSLTSLRLAQLTTGHPSVRRPASTPIAPATAPVPAPAPAPGPAPALPAAALSFFQLSTLQEAIIGLSLLQPTAQRDAAVRQSPAIAVLLPLCELYDSHESFRAEVQARRAMYEDVVRRQQGSQGQAVAAS